MGLNLVPTLLELLMGGVQIGDSNRGRGVREESAMGQESPLVTSSTSNPD